MMMETAVREGRIFYTGQGVQDVVTSGEPSWRREGRHREMPHDRPRRRFHYPLFRARTQIFPRWFRSRACKVASWKKSRSQALGRLWAADHAEPAPRRIRRNGHDWLHAKKMIHHPERDFDGVKTMSTFELQAETGTNGAHRAHFDSQSARWQAPRTQEEVRAGRGTFRRETKSRKRRRLSKGGS